MKTYGLQTRLARLTKIPQPRMSLIWRGLAKPTPHQAALLEAALLREGYSITRFDMLFSPKGTPLLGVREAIEADPARGL